MTRTHRGERLGAHMAARKIKPRRPGAALVRLTTATV